MKLKRVSLENFRSIKKQEITFDPTCRVLVGINESGKSNILRALSFLSESYKPSKTDDLREALPDEEPIDSSSIMFVFSLEKQESDNLLETVVSSLLTTEKDPPLVLKFKETLSIREYCASRNEALYTIDILEESKRRQYWTVTYKLLPDWKKLSAKCPEDFSIQHGDQSLKLSNYKLIRATDFPDIPPEYLEPAAIDDLGKISGNSILELAKENMPDVIYWKYDEKNLLPNLVNITRFCGDPNSCIPLKNMFTLAGIADIAESINNAKSRGNNQFQNYLSSIASKTTSHFRSVWEEYKTIEFSLRIDGDNIVPGVKEINTLDFAKRSDGFKRFVTFLLMISVNVKTDNLNDTLLLIDEPEIGLHPSGARYLRNELIRISKTNYVVYSTHSIFMIDPGDIGRHIIVKKEGEITDLSIAKESNVADEEVLFNALGHSIFANLREKNLIFEGWNDKKLFQVALLGASTPIVEKYVGYGICHARGVGTIRTITPMIELANRQCVIISDSDKPAKTHQKEYKADKGYGKWYTYQDVDSSIKAITGEDFVDSNFIGTHVKAALKHSKLPEFDSSKLPASGKIAYIQAWLAQNGMDGEQIKDTLKKIKANTFEKLEFSHIDASYMKLMRALKA